MLDQFAMSSMCLPQPRQIPPASNTHTLMHGESGGGGGGCCIDNEGEEEVEVTYPEDVLVCNIRLRESLCCVDHLALLESN